MQSRFLHASFALALSACLPAWTQLAKPQTPARNGGDFSDNAQPLNKVPEGVILVKGAWSSASDSTTPLPEGGEITNNVLTNRYFGMTYPLPADWVQKYEGPPPSESGRYVLAQISPASTYKGPSRGSILITAQDMFFSPLSATSALDLVDYSKDHLQVDYKVELPPSRTRIANQPFTFFAYWSPVSEMHWYVLAADIRCHAVQIVLTSRDTKLLESLVADLNKFEIAKDRSLEPVCLKDYAREENLITRADPVFTQHKFNAVPVRIVIDKEGNVKHIHFLSAFPDQAKAITDAMAHWKFKRYMRNGQPLEVETGIMFGHSNYPAFPGTTATTE